MVTTNVKLY